MDKVNKYTRAGKLGKVIVCPCGAKATVYHFAWSALKCQACGNMVEKVDFFYEK
jgi:ribosomal protein S27E